MILGVLGGIGSGKSTVARLLGEAATAQGLRNEIVDADALAREAIESPDVKRDLQEWLGDAVIAADGSLDRKVIADAVFTSPEKLAQLEALIHPRVLKTIERRVRAHEQRTTEAAGSSAVLILDVPLLVETGLHERCDALVFVEARLKTRLSRVADTRGWEPAELERREARQHPVDEKRRVADLVIDNSGDEQASRRAAAEALASLLSSRKESKQREKNRRD